MKMIIMKKAPTPETCAIAVDCVVVMVMFAVVVMLMNALELVVCESKVERDF